MSKTYALIGSRETPEEALEIMRQVVARLCIKGWRGRSGGADGADTCLEQGVFAYLDWAGKPRTYADDYMEVFLPWKDFNGRSSYSAGYYTLPWLECKDKARLMAKEIHPAWDALRWDRKLGKEVPVLSEGAKSMHTRNIMQVLGKDLESPSKFIICWAPPKYKDRRTEECKGGTGTAVALGIDNGVEIINIYHKDQKERLLKFIS